jgi:hypothetical protein
VVEDHLLWFASVSLWCSNRSFALELDMEVSAERKPPFVDRAGEECSLCF